MHRRSISSGRSRPQPTAGFTLIEVLIAIVVVSILAAIAVPQYTDFVMRARITDATATMDDIRVRMEQFFQDNRRYDAGGNCGILNAASFSTTNFQYTCAPVGAPAQSYAVVAQGLNMMSQFSYTLTVAPGGVTRSTPTVHTGWSLPAPNDCWAVRKNGKCS